MATTQSTERRVDTSETPSDVFDAAIWYNDDVCNHCFAHVRDVDQREIRVGKNNQKQLDWEFRDRTTRSQLDHDVVAKGETGTVATRDEDGRVIGSEPIETHSAQYRETTRTTCLQCGSVGCLATDETLSRREALARVDTLAERLRERGHSLSERHLRATIRRGKERADVQGYDREIFAAAVKVALRHG
jgi:hypothetical protein